MKKLIYLIPVIIIFTTGCLTYSPKYTPTALIIALKFNDNNFITVKNINLVNELSEELKNLLYIKDLLSITNVDYIEGFESGFEIFKLEDYIPESANELNIFRNKMMDWDIYENILYTHDGSWVSFILTFDENIPSEQKIIDDISNIKNKYSERNFHLLISDIKILRESDYVRFFKDINESIIEDYEINNNFAGANVINLKIMGKNPGDLAEPEILIAMDELKNELEMRFDKIGKIISFSDMIKRMNYVMHYDNNKEEYNELPSDITKYPGVSKHDELKTLITQYLLLYSGSLDNYAGEDVLEPDYAKMLIFVKELDPILIKDILLYIKKYSIKNFERKYKIKLDDKF